MDGEETIKHSSAFDSVLCGQSYGSKTINQLTTKIINRKLYEVSEANEIKLEDLDDAKRPSMTLIPSKYRILHMRTIYTYHIAWTRHNKHYYGIRFANTLDPELDLWNVYFTSSKIVKDFRKKHGEPDIIEIRKKFKVQDHSTFRSAATKALKWKKKVLSRLNVKLNENWLNKAADGKKRSRKTRTPDQNKAAKGKGKGKKKNLDRIRKQKQKIEKKHAHYVEVSDLPKKKNKYPISKNVKVYNKKSRRDRKVMLNGR